MQPRFDLSEDDTPPFAHSDMARLAERLEGRSPYPLGAAFFYYTNPAFSAQQPARLVAALDRIPFLVSFSPFMDETTDRCDLVLPDHTYLERWQLDEIPPSVGYPVFGMRQPVVEPRHDTCSTGEALIRIARAVGGSVARSFPWDEIEMIRMLVRGVHESGRGSIREATFDDFWKQHVPTEPNFSTLATEAADAAKTQNAESQAEAAATPK